MSKFHDIRTFRSWVIEPNVIVRLNHRSKMKRSKEAIFFKLCETAAEAQKIIQKVYGEKRFGESREDLNDDERSGRPRSAVNEENAEIVREFIKREPKSSFQRGKRPMLCFIFVLWNVRKVTFGQERKALCRHCRHSKVDERHPEHKFY